MRPWKSIFRLWAPTSCAIVRRCCMLRVLGMGYSKQRRDVRAGRRSTIGNRVYARSVSGVRIPISPPEFFARERVAHHIRGLGPHPTEGWQSGRLRRSRKPFHPYRGDQGSNPCPSARNEQPRNKRGFFCGPSPAVAPSAADVSQARSCRSVNSCFPFALCSFCF